jgi:hypothetical protein
MLQSWKESKDLEFQIRVLQNKTLTDLGFKAVEAIIDEKDIVIMLFDDNITKEFQQEFTYARDRCALTGKPKIAGYFKGSASAIQKSNLKYFKMELKNFGHLHAPYKNINDLTLDFPKQLKLLLKSKPQTK